MLKEIIGKINNYLFKVLINTSLLSKRSYFFKTSTQIFLAGKLITE